MPRARQLVFTLLGLGFVAFFFHVAWRRGFESLEGAAAAGVAVVFIIFVALLLRPNKGAHEHSPNPQWRFWKILLGAWGLGGATFIVLAALASMHGPESVEALFKWVLPLVIAFGIAWSPVLNRYLK